MNRLLGLVIHNFGWKLLALASAFVIWALVASEPELSTFRTVPLEYRNLPNNLDLSSAPMEAVSLELRGPAGELRNGEVRRPAVVIDLSSVTPGQHTYTINEADLSLPRGVRLVRAIPSEVRLDFENRISRTIPVQIRLTGESANGYVVAQESVWPDKLVVSGPASHVSRIQAAVTDPVNVSSVFGAAEFHANAYVPDPYVHLETSPEVVISVTMKKGSQP